MFAGTKWRHKIEVNQVVNARALQHPLLKELR